MGEVRKERRGWGNNSSPFFPQCVSGEALPDQATPLCVFWGSCGQHGNLPPVLHSFPFQTPPFPHPNVALLESTSSNKASAQKSPSGWFLGNPSEDKAGSQRESMASMCGVGGRLPSLVAA